MFYCLEMGDGYTSVTPACPIIRYYTWAPIVQWWISSILEWTERADGVSSCHEWSGCFTIYILSMTHRAVLIFLMRETLSLTDIIYALSLSPTAQTHHQADRGYTRLCQRYISKIFERFHYSGDVEAFRETCRVKASKVWYFGINGKVALRGESWSQCNN